MEIVDLKPRTTHLVLECFPSLSNSDLIDRYVLKTVMLESVAIIEDNLDYVESLMESLMLITGRELTFHIASNPKQANSLIDRIISNEISVNAVLLDRKLRDEDDGDKLAERLRTGGFKGVIIGISGQQIQGTLESITQNGIHIPKTNSPYKDAGDIYNYLVSQGQPA